MKKELKEQDLNSVAGGMYAIDNENKLYFSTLPDAEYQLTKTSRYQAQGIMDELIGKYDTQKEYDQACIKELTAAGII